METESVKKTEQWAKDSRNHGLWSIGLLMLLFLTFLFWDNSEYGSGSEFYLNCLFFLLAFANVASGISTCIIAFIALWRNRREGNDATIKRTATIGLVLGVIPLALLCILIFTALFTVFW